MKSNILGSKKKKSSILGNSAKGAGIAAVGIIGSRYGVAGALGKKAGMGIRSGVSGQIGDDLYKVASGLKRSGAKMQYNSAKNKTILDKVGNSVGQKIKNVGNRVETASDNVNAYAVRRGIKSRLKK